MENTFKTRFDQLQKTCAKLGDVRNLGAMCALEFVKNKETKEPDKELTAQIITKAHQKGLIVMSAGLYGNIIRLLTPLVIKDEHLEEGLTILEETILECCKK